MGYFDAVDNKIDKIQEAGDLERYAGNAFWFNIGSCGVFVHALIFSLVFWTQFGALGQLFSGGSSSPKGISGEAGLAIVLILCLVFLLSVFLSVVGLIFNLKAHKSASLIREKNELNTMATSFNILWIVLDVICIAMNFVFFSQTIALSL